MRFTTTIIRVKRAKLVCSSILAWIVICNTLLLGLHTTHTLHPHYLSKSKKSTFDWLSKSSIISILEAQKNLPAVGITSHINNTKNNLMNDMERCSVAMGIDRHRINYTNLDRVATNTLKLLEAIQSILPKQYLPNIRNPCWYSNMTVSEKITELLEKNLNSRSNKLSSEGIAKVYNQIFNQQLPSTNSTMYCLPAFFIGGFPKSGTTSFHYALKHHPSIQPPTIKEPHWWTRIPLKSFNNDYLTVLFVRYLQYFKTAAKQIAENRKSSILTYDGSTSTIWDSNLATGDQDYCALPTLMSRLFPHMKMIILMRDPIDRLYSDYYFSCSLQYGNNISNWPKIVKNDPMGNFHKRVMSDITHFNKCVMSGWSYYECANKMRSRLSTCGFLGDKLIHGMYTTHIQKWMQFYPEGNFLFLTTKQLSQNPYWTLTQTTQFLGINPVDRYEAETWLSVHQNVQRAVPITLKMYNKTRTMLQDFYQPFNAQLNQLLGHTVFK